MSLFNTRISSPTAARNWTDLKATGQVLKSVKDGHFALRTNVASRVAVGVGDPGSSNTAGIATVPNEAVEIILGAKAASQTIWVQTPADQSDVYVDIETAGARGPVLIAV